MTPTQVLIGNASTSQQGDILIIGASSIRAYVGNNVSTACWIHTWRGRVGRASGQGTPWARPICYETDGGGDPDPDDLRCYFNSLSPGTLFDDNAGGAVLSSAISGGVKGAMAYAGENLAVALHARTNDLMVGMKQSANISSADQRDFFNRTSGVSGTGVPDPMAWTTRSTEGWMTSWLVADANETPLAPSGTFPSGTILTITPDCGGDFQDPNGAYGGAYDRGDYMTKAQVQIRRKSDSVTFWDNTYAVTTGERDANRSLKGYAGTTMVRGTVYQQRVRHGDRFDAWGLWSGWIDFTPSAQGTVTLAGNPTGKWDDTTPDVDFTWNHQTALSTNQAIVKFYKGNTLVATSSAVAITVANGASGTVPWASMGIATPLEPGQVYGYTVEARDTTSVWTSPSAKRTFTVDAAPTTPTGLAPTGGVILSSSAYPKLQARFSDPDDNVAGGLVGKYELLWQDNFTNPAMATDLSNWGERFKDTGWTYSATRDAAIFEAAAGSAKLAITACPGTANKKLRYGTTDTLPCVVGETYTRRMALRKDHATDLHVRSFIDWYTSADVYLSTTEGANIADTINTFLESVVTGAAPATAAKYRAGFLVENRVTSLGATRNVWADGLAASPGTAYDMIKRGNLTLVSGDAWERQTDATDLPGTGKYKWRAYSGDGYLWSGGALTEAAASRSAEALFEFQAVPNVTVTAPADSATIDNTTPTTTWTVANQDKYRVRWLLNGTDEVYTSGWVSNSATRSITLPVGYTRNGGSYTVEVGVEYATLQGFDTSTAVLIAYTPPPSLGNFTASPATIGGEPFPTAAQIDFDQYAGSAFYAYIIDRDDLADPAAIIYEVSQHSWIDYHAPVDGATYSGRVVETRGQELVDSDDATAVIDNLPISGVVLVSIEQPQTERFVSPAWDGIAFTLEGEESNFRTWGATAPIPIVAEATWHTGALAFKLTEETGDPKEDRLALEALARTMGFSYRDRDAIRYFLRIPSGTLKLTRQRSGRYNGAMQVTEIGYTEGVHEQ